MIIRVFPRRTKATPTDALTYFGPPGGHTMSETDTICFTFGLLAGVLLDFIIRGI